VSGGRSAAGSVTGGWAQPAAGRVLGEIGAGPLALVQGLVPCLPGLGE